MVWFGVCFLFIGLSFMSGEAVEENPISYHADAALHLLRAAGAAAAAAVPGAAAAAAAGAGAGAVDGTAAEEAAIREWLSATGGPWVQLLAAEMGDDDDYGGAAPGGGLAPHCVWRTDGWSYVGMVLIAWVMLWLVSILNQASGPGPCHGSHPCPARARHGWPSPDPSPPPLRPPPTDGRARARACWSLRA